MSLKEEVAAVLKEIEGSEKAQALWDRISEKLDSEGPKAIDLILEAELQSLESRFKEARKAFLQERSETHVED